MWFGLYGKAIEASGLSVWLHTFLFGSWWLFFAENRSWHLSITAALYHFPVHQMEVLISGTGLDRLQLKICCRAFRIVACGASGTSGATCVLFENRKPTKGVQYWSLHTRHQLTINFCAICLMPTGQRNAARLVALSLFQWFLCIR